MRRNFVVGINDRSLAVGSRFITKPTKKITYYQHKVVFILTRDDTYEYGKTSKR